METRASTQSVLYQKIGLIIKGIGAFVVLSGLLVNPWLGRFYRRNIIEYQDVMLTYFIWSVSIGLIIIGLGIMFRRMKSPTAVNIIILSLTCLLIVLSDRILLAWYGLPLWVADIEKHYAHRPNTIRLWGPSFDNKLIRINQHGHHDDDFPIDKADDEFRGLMIGDSITMGHGMIYEDTFPNQLEDILREKNGDHITYQMINAGVQGYSTFQEYHSLM